MKSILINAYACAPNMGSEPGMAWNWIINLANYCKVYVITEGEWRQEIEDTISKLPQGKNMVFYYSPVSDKVRKMCWNQGDWRFYYYYIKWQKKTLKIATEIIKDNQIDLVHHLNMIGFREPGYLWKIEDKPYIWGPIDAKSNFPVQYLRGADIGTKMYLRLKNFITKIQLKTSTRIRKALKKADFVISATTYSVTTLENYLHYDSVLINETGCYVKTQLDNPKSINKGTFDILWVGKFDYRKQLGLAIKTIAQLNLPEIKFHIVGDYKTEEGEYYMKLARELKINDKIIWHGKVSHHTVQKIMQESDLFFFTSVAEGTPHVILEAIGNNLPVLCFNTCGQGDIVNENVGIKIELSSPSQSIEEFANRIEYIYKNSDILLNLSKNCYIRQQELSWDNKALQMVGLYEKAIENYILRSNS
jgi:glycosyltransferase involved in cell wall biosynthesis